MLRPTQTRLPLLDEEQDRHASSDVKQQQRHQNYIDEMSAELGEAFVSEFVQLVDKELTAEHRNSIHNDAQCGVKYLNL